jgi:hypothetical protein
MVRRVNAQTLQTGVARLRPRIVDPDVSLKSPAHAIVREAGNLGSSSQTTRPRVSRTQTVIN